MKSLSYILTAFVLISTYVLPVECKSMHLLQDTTKFQQDSLSVPDTLEKSEGTIISGEKKTETFRPFEMQKSPTGAILRSLVLPGWGQFYVESYWKVPLFLGAAGGLTYGFFYYNDFYQERQDFYDRLIAENPNDARLTTLKAQKEFYRDQRDMMAFYFLGVYVLAAVDAYVGAHLYDFTVDDVDASISVEPCTTCGLSITLRISPF